MNIDGDIVLCGRSDGDAQRGYSGQLAELAIWDQSLSEADVAKIFQAVRQELEVVALQCHMGCLQKILLHQSKLRQ